MGLIYDGSIIKLLCKSIYTHSSSRWKMQTRSLYRDILDQIVKGGTAIALHQGNLLVS